MKLIRFLRKASPLFGLWLLLAALLSGAANAGMIAIVDLVIHHPTPGSVNENYAAAFLAVMIVFLLSQLWVQTRLVKLSQQLVTELRLGIIQRLRRATFVSFEKTAQEKIYTALTRDTAVIANTAPGLVYAGTHLVTVIFCFAYLAWLSLPAFAIALSVMGLGVGLYMWRDQPITRKLRAAREKENDFFRLLSQFLSGYKELKMSQSRSDALHDSWIRRVSEEARELTTQGMLGYVHNALTAQAFIFLLVGLVIFAVPAWFPTATPAIPGLAILILYMLGPVEALINVVPAFANAGIALSRLEQLEAETDSLLRETAQPLPAPAPGASLLSLHEVRWTHRDAKGQATFELGPVSLDFKPGQINFIVGGNGSGKSTLMRILTGLYHPQAGELKWQGLPVNEAQLPAYRAQVSAVFSDHYLFDRLFEWNGLRDEEVNEQLAQFGLGGIVRFDAGAFSTLELSSGQRKRLALIVALLDDRPLLLFDEWAADQDPQFRRHFYETLLPQWKAAGKTIIAVTHDDAWFHCADRVVKLEWGKVKP